MGAAGSNWPRVFSPFFPLFFPRQEDWRQPHELHQARFALDFSLFFPRQEEWHPHELHQARLALVFSFFFFHARRSGVRRRGGFRRMERTRPDSPSIFVPPFFPRQEEWHPPQEWHPPHGPQARIALVFFPFRVFPPFLRARRSGIRMGRTRPDSPSCFFPLFSAPGGVASAWAAPGPTRLRVFSPFFPRQVEWDGAGSSGWKVPRRPDFFFTRLRRLAT